MASSRTLVGFLAGGVRLVALAGLVVGLQYLGPVLGLVPSTAEALVPAGRDDSLHRALVDTERRLRDVFESARSLGADQEALRQVVNENLREERGEREAFESRLAALRRAVDEGLELERGRISGAAHRAEANARQIETISRRFQRDPPTMRRSMIAPTAQLRGNKTVGSGVLIYSEKQTGKADGGAAVYTTFVLTAYHVVLEVTGDGPSPDVVSDVRVITGGAAHETESFAAEMVLQDRDRDLALLRLNTTRQFGNLARFLPRAAVDEVDIFTAAYAVGCPLGNSPIPTLGEVSSRRKQVGDQNFWMLSAPTFFGNSGGGVYLAESCELIGISSMIYTYGKRSPTVVPHMGLFVPLETVYDWLDENDFGFIHERAAIPTSRASELVFGAAAKSSTTKNSTAKSSTAKRVTHGDL